MKALLLPLLAANLALQPGTALQCYSCEDQGNNEGCQRVQNPCPASPSLLPPTEAIGLLTVISKGCSSHCVEDSGNSFRSKKMSHAAPPTCATPAGPRPCGWPASPGRCSVLLAVCCPGAGPSC
ncbi:hypothetical protein K5549_003326, partial [Capra hircus]